MHRLHIATCLALAACTTAPTTPPETKVVAKVVTSGLVNPWAVAVLPDGRFLVTEKNGTLRFVSAGGEKSAPLAGVPAVSTDGQGGLLDLALAPDFATSGTLYFTYAEAGAGGSGTALATAKVGDAALTDVQVLWRQEPKVSGGNHYGSRVVVAPDGRLFVTTGERNQRELSQQLNRGQGKVVRVNADGSIPQDNPFISTPDAQPEIWSYGHRNIQGAAINPTTGELWTNEHGPRGGDELNATRAGKNYGWPLITYGREYSGGEISGGATAREGLEQPLHYWVPSIATSGLAFITKETYPSWKDSVLIGGLVGTTLVRLEFDGETVTREERLLTELGERIRDVREGPDGTVFVLTDEANGKLYRLEVAP